MAKCFSFTTTMDACYQRSFEWSGLMSTTADLGEGTTVHCWAPKRPKPGAPALVLLHGFGSNAMWQWDPFLSSLTPRFNVYVPDLLFFGESYTSRPDRSESFQARSVMGLLDRIEVQGRVSAVGVSYGGFVAYSLAAQFPERVERVVLVCAGVSLEERDMDMGMFKVSSVEEATELLVPTTPKKLRELLRLSFYKPNKFVPNCFLQDYIQVVCTEYREQKKQLIETLHKDRKFENLPKINQRVLIVWGEHDQVFPIELAHRLKRHLGDNAELVVVKKAGHAINIEKPKKLCRHIKAFLMGSPPRPASSGNGDAANAS